MHTNITTSRPLTAKEEKLLAVIEGGLLGFGGLRSVSMVSPADFREVMHRPTLDLVRQAVRDLMGVRWVSIEHPDVYQPIVVGFAGRDSVNALVVEFCSAYVRAREDDLPEHRH